MRLKAPVSLLERRNQKKKERKRIKPNPLRRVKTRAQKGRRKKERRRERKTLNPRALIELKNTKLSKHNESADKILFAN